MANRTITITLRPDQAWDHMTDKQIMEMLIGPYHVQSFRARVVPEKGRESGQSRDLALAKGHQRRPSDPEE